MKRLSCLAFAAGLWLFSAVASAEVKEGQKAPDVELPVTGKAKTIKLKELMGKNVVVYFFPKALTKG